MRKLPSFLTGATVAVLALTGCAPDAEPEAAAESPAPITAETPTPDVTEAPEPTEPAEPVETPTPEPTPTLSIADCEYGPTALIRLPSHAYHPSYTGKPEFEGEIFDTGPRELAAGEPNLNADGQIVSYTVLPGESLIEIAARFCIHLRTFGAYNHTFGYDIQPGQVLVLRPDPDVPWSWDR